MCGLGYPEEVKGDDIHVFGRLIGDAYALDAMTSDRSYRKGMTIEKALSILEEGKGTQWDEEFVEAFMRGIKVTGTSRILSNSAI